MVDVLTPEQRSKIMARITSKDTSPEKIVRSILHGLGYRYRLHRSDMPGKPDIVLPKYKTVIFVHGCFWHMHKGCKRGNIPKSNVEYWLPKLKRNAQRDRKHVRQLRNMGWKVIIIWECKTKDIDKLSSRLSHELR